MSSTYPSDPAASTTSPAKVSAITPSLTLFFAAAVAIVVLNLYASQPLIGLIGPAFGMSLATASLVTTFTLLGYSSPSGRVSPSHLLCGVLVHSGRVAATRQITRRYFIFRRWRAPS